MSQVKPPHHAWYKLAAWTRRREALLAAEPLCRMCLAGEVVEPATVADHVVPHRGDPDLFWHGELQPLCASCHSRHKQREERGQAVVRFGLDGWPM